MEFLYSKNCIHDIWCMLRPYPEAQMKCETSCYRNMRYNLRKKCLKLYKICKKSENKETCLDVMLSHVEAMIKNWEGFEQVVTSDA